MAIKQSRNKNVKKYYKNLDCDYTEDINVKEKKVFAYRVLERHKKTSFELSKLPSNSKILDYGCGTGSTIKICLENTDHHYTGIDLSKKLIETAGKNIKDHRVKFYCGDVEETIKEKVDCVISLEVIEHLEDRKKFLTNIHKVLKESGLLILSTRNLIGIWTFTACVNRPKIFYKNIGGVIKRGIINDFDPLYPFHYRFLSSTLNNEIENAGFKVLKLDMFDYYIPLLMTTSNYSFFQSLFKKIPILKNMGNGIFIVAKKV